MKTMCIMATSLLFLLGCSPKTIPQQQAQRPATTPAVDKQAPMPEPLAIATAVPAAVITGTVTTEVSAVTQQLETVSATNAPPSNAIIPTSAADKALVFDLSTIPLDTIALEKQGIRVRELNNLRILEFNTNSTPLVVKVDNLPTGAMARTLFAVGRFDEVRRDAGLISYGMAGTLGRWCHLGVDFANNIAFMPYGNEVAYGICEMGSYYALAAVYDGQRCILYVNGVKVADMQIALVTPMTSLMIGANFAGTVVDAKIYNRELSESEIRQLSSADLDMVK